LSDHLWLDLREGGRTGFAGALMRETDSGTLVGYAQVSRGNTQRGLSSWSLDVIIHPHHRYDSREIAPPLMRAALDVVADEGGGHLHWWVFEPNNLHADLATEFGLAPGRRLLQMRVPLPQPGPPSGLATRPFQPGLDEDAWLEVNNAAFAHHPEQGGWEREVLESREREAWFDPDGFLLHWHDEKLAGFCWTKVHEPGGTCDDHGNPMGEIYVIAVAPWAAGTGLGSQLVRAGLEHLARRGVATGMLYVDQDNTRAVAMYESLGFVTHHVEVAFVGEVRP
jgi:mycothiol synthase